MDEIFKFSLIALSCIFTGCVPMAITSATATTAAVVHDRRTVGSILDDQTIEFRAQLKMEQIPEVRDYVMSW